MSRARTAVDDAPITKLVDAMSAGDRDAREALFRVVYDDLRRIARAQLRGQRRGHTLQATALVHEAFLKIERGPRSRWANRSHFFCAAARVMRSILVDHARARTRTKRGGRAGARSDSYLVEQAADLCSAAGVQIVDLDDALREFAKLDARAAAVVEMRFFGGRSVPEIARAMGLSVPTVERDWTAARAWLRLRLA